MPFQDLGMDPEMVKIVASQDGIVLSMANKDL
jgi:hypothetical protein